MCDYSESYKGGRPYAFVENVVTHADYRKMGYATSCLDLAKQIARGNNCYKMILLTGSKEESILNFIERQGIIVRIKRHLFSG